MAKPLPRWNSPSLDVTVQEGQVHLRSSDGAVHETLDNAMAFLRTDRGGRHIAAVGMGLERMRAVGAELPSGERAKAKQDLARLEIAPAFDPVAFDPELAMAFLAYVATGKGKFGTWRRLPVHLVFPGFEEVPEDARAAFLRQPVSPELTVNGRAVWTTAREGGWRAVTVTVPVLLFVPFLLSGIVPGLLGEGHGRAVVVLALGALPAMALLALARKRWVRRQVRRSVRRS